MLYNAPYMFHCLHISKFIFLSSLLYAREINAQETGLAFLVFLRRLNYNSYISVLLENFR